MPKKKPEKTEKTVAKGEWTCLTPKCDILVRKTEEGPEFRFVCPKEEYGYMKEVQQDIANPDKRKIFEVTKKAESK